MGSTGLSGPSLRDVEFDDLRRALRGLAGLVFDDQSRYMMERRLGERVAELRLSSFGEYVRLLEGDRAEQEVALDLVTTKETYFFRQEYQLKGFVAEVVPRMAEASREFRRLTVWSAGCSTGEEAYTLAILLMESPALVGWNVQVVGTDLSRTNVEHAKRGEYRMSAFRVRPPEELERHIERRDGNFVVRPHLRRMCHFSQANLLSPTEVRSIGRVDAAFCRNVLIYMDEEGRRRVTETIYERLMPGGYLLLGHTESLLNMKTRFETVHLSSDIIYQRPPDSLRPPRLGGAPL